MNNLNLEERFKENNIFSGNTYKYKIIFDALSSYLDDDINCYLAYLSLCETCNIDRNLSFYKKYEIDIKLTKELINNIEKSIALKIIQNS